MSRTAAPRPTLRSMGGQRRSGHALPTAGFDRAVVSRHTPPALPGVRRVAYAGARPASPAREVSHPTAQGAQTRRHGKPSRAASDHGRPCPRWRDRPSEPARTRAVRRLTARCVRRARHPPPSTGGTGARPASCSSRDTSPTRAKPGLPRPASASSPLPGRRTAPQRAHHGVSAHVPQVPRFRAEPPAAVRSSAGPRGCSGAPSVRAPTMRCTAPAAARPEADAPAGDARAHRRCTRGSALGTRAAACGGRRTCQCRANRAARQRHRLAKPASCHGPRWKPVEATNSALGSRPTKSAGRHSGWRSVFPPLPALERTPVSERPESVPPQPLLTSKFLPPEPLTELKSRAARGSRRGRRYNGASRPSSKTRVPFTCSVPAPFRRSPSGMPAVTDRPTSPIPELPAPHPQLRAARRPHDPGPAACLRRHWARFGLDFRRRAARFRRPVRPPGAAGAGDRFRQWRSAGLGQRARSGARLPRHRSARPGRGPADECAGRARRRATCASTSTTRWRCSSTRSRRAPWPKCASGFPTPGTRSATTSGASCSPSSCAAGLAHGAGGPAAPGHRLAALRRAHARGHGSGAGLAQSGRPGPVRRKAGLAHRDPFRTARPAARPRRVATCSTAARLNASPARLARRFTQPLARPAYTLALNQGRVAAA